MEKKQKAQSDAGKMGKEKNQKIIKEPKKVKGAKTVKTPKKAGVKLTGKIVGIVVAAMSVLTVAIIVTVLICMNNLANVLVEDKLETTAYAVESHYGSLSASDYNVSDDGMLYKGMMSLAYEKDYIYEMRDEMGTYTSVFYDGKAYISSYKNSDGSDNLKLTLSDEVVKAVNKDGYYFTSSLDVDGVTYYGYYMSYAEAEDGSVRGIVLVAVNRDETWSNIATYLVIIAVVILAIVVLAIILLALFIRMIIKTIRKSVGHMEKVSKGYLNFELDGKMVARKDEVGDMARGIQLIINNFKDVVTRIFDASKSLAEFSNKFGESFGRITDTMGNVNIAVDEIANGATSQADETMTAKNEMVNMGNAIEEASSNVENLGESSKKMTGYSDQARNTLEELSHINEKTMASVNTVQGQTNLTNQSALEIQAATDLIADIASQTNLLSLNASIEAARAGENGRGFAVVADEIRNLADQSRQSAEKIADIVNKLIENSNDSVETMNNVKGIMTAQSEKIVDTQKMFTSLNDEIASVNDAIIAIKTEMGNLNELKTVVATSIENLAAIAGENAASTEETSASMSELSNIVDMCSNETRELVGLAEGLNQCIQEFKL